MKDLSEEVQTQCEELRCEAEGNREDWAMDYPHVAKIMHEAADLIERLARENKCLRSDCAAFDALLESRQQRIEEANAILDEYREEKREYLKRIEKLEGRCSRFGSKVSQLTARIRAMGDE